MGDTQNYPVGPGGAVLNTGSAPFDVHYVSMREFKNGAWEDANATHYLLPANAGADMMVTSKLNGCTFGIGSDAQGARLVSHLRPPNIDPSSDAQEVLRGTRARLCGSWRNHRNQGQLDDAGAGYRDCPALRHGLDFLYPAFSGVIGAALSDQRGVQDTLRQPEPAWPRLTSVSQSDRSVARSGSTLHRISQACRALITYATEVKDWLLLVLISEHMRNETCGAPKIFEGVWCSGSCPELLLQRSPPWSFATAAWSGLGPAPESRSRGAYPHLSRSFTTSLWLASFHSVSAAHMNSATFSAADPATTTSQPPADAVTSFTVPELRSRSCRSHDQVFSAGTLRRKRRET